MGRKIDMVGKKYGRLTVIKENGMTKHGNAKWDCLCECGNIVNVVGSNLRHGITSSCGCFQKERAREARKKISNPNCFYKKPWFGSYKSMLRRCYDEKEIGYKRYGGRGIKVCEEWHDIANFEKWVNTSNYSKGLTIDRIDNDKDYGPNNCRWVDMRVQSNNRRNTIYFTNNGETHSAGDWARILNVDISVLHRRRSKGWTDKEILETPFD